MDNKTYIYTPWLRSGLGVAIKEQDNLGNNNSGSCLLRAEIAFTTKFNLSKIKEGETDTKTEQKSIIQTFPIQGPVDIRSINENMVLKTVPAQGVNNFEYNFAPYIDFKEKDFPWIYSPVSANGEKMRPWLKLLVCKIDQCVVNADCEFPFVTLSIEDETKYQQIMGEASEAWKYAHVQLVEESLDDNSNLSEHVKSKIDDCESNFVSRILSTCLLEKDSAYLAFLIPGFETGRLAGLGISLSEIEKSKIKTQESSFTTKLLEQRKKKRGLDFPFYYKWNFGTGDGSFHVLAQRLQAASAAELPKDVCVDVSHMGDGLDYVNLPPSQKRRETIGVPMAVKPLLYNEEIFPNPSENEGEKILERNILNKLKKAPVFSENLELLNEKVELLIDQIATPTVMLPSGITIERVLQRDERGISLKTNKLIEKKEEREENLALINSTLAFKIRAEKAAETEEIEKEQKILSLINSIKAFKISDIKAVKTEEIEKRQKILALINSLKAFKIRDIKAVKIEEIEKRQKILALINSIKAFKISNLRAVRIRNKRAALLSDKNPALLLDPKNVVVREKTPVLVSDKNPARLIDPKNVLGIDEIAVLVSDFGASMDDPWIVPPIYGAKHAMSTSLEKSPNWLRSLNLDIKNRIAAGLGVKVIQENQEMFMQRAWEQVELVNQLNQLIYNKLLQLKSNNMLYKQHAAFSDNLIQGLSSMKLITEMKGAGGNKSGILSMANDAMLRITSKKNIQDTIDSNGLVETMAQNAQFVFKHKHPFYDENAIDLFSQKLKDIVKTLAAYIENEYETKLTTFEHAMSTNEIRTEMDKIYQDFDQTKKRKIDELMQELEIVKDKKLNLFTQIANDFPKNETPLYEKLKKLKEIDNSEAFLKSISKGFEYNKIVDDNIKKTFGDDISFGIICPKQSDETLPKESIFYKDIAMELFDYIPITNIEEYKGVFLARQFYADRAQRQVLPYELKKENYQRENSLTVIIPNDKFVNIFGDICEKILEDEEDKEFKNKHIVINVGNIQFANIKNFGDFAFDLYEYSLDNPKVFEFGLIKSFIKWSPHENIRVLTERLKNENYSSRQVKYSPLVSYTSIKPKHKLETADLHISRIEHPTYKVSLADFLDKNTILDALNVIAICADILELIKNAKRTRENYEDSHGNNIAYTPHIQEGVIKSEISKLRDESIQKPETLKKDVEIIIKNIEEHVNNSFKYLVSKINSENLDEYIDTEFPVIAYPVFPEPASLYLQELSENFIIPETDKIPQNSISLYMSNSKFVESFLCGMNTEMAQEMFWREYPTDKRGSYFKTFWDKDEDLLLDHYSDIKSIHEWKNDLGNNQINNKVKDLLVFVVRGDLIKKFPDVISYLSPAQEGADNKIHFMINSEDALIYPKLRNLIRKDILLLGFEINAWDAIKRPGNFLVFQERPTGIRFGDFKEKKRVNNNDSAQFAKEHMVQPYIYAKHISSFL